MTKESDKVRARYGETLGEFYQKKIFSSEMKKEHDN
jgi:hypothetical protein